MELQILIKVANAKFLYHGAINMHSKVITRSQFIALANKFLCNPIPDKIDCIGSICIPFILINQSSYTLFTSSNSSYCMHANSSSPFYFSDLRSVVCFKINGVGWNNDVCYLKPLQTIIRRTIFDKDTLNNSLESENGSYQKTTEKSITSALHQTCTKLVSRVC